jgi:hypothetical protein
MIYLQNNEFALYLILVAYFLTSWVQMFPSAILPATLNLYSVFMIRDKILHKFEATNGIKILCCNLTLSAGPLKRW